MGLDTAALAINGGMRGQRSNLSFPQTTTLSNGGSFDAQLYWRGRIVLGHKLMHVLFVHQNFPAQFGHIAAYLVQRKGFRSTFVSQQPPGNDGGVERIQYQIRGGATQQTHYCSRSFENAIWHSHAVFEALQARPDIKPETASATAAIWNSPAESRSMSGCLPVTSTICRGSFSPG